MKVKCIGNWGSHNFAEISSANENACPLINGGMARSYLECGEIPSMEAFLPPLYKSKREKFLVKAQKEDT